MQEQGNQGNQPQPGEPGYDPTLDPNSPEYDAEKARRQGQQDQRNR